jgi:spore cortex formation protein SpoVR/YcgB (stage V sporulation)
MRNFKDESFIQQFLSPHLIRELKLFSIVDDSEQPTLKVSAIHNETGYRRIREELAAQYNLGNREPNIQVYAVDVRGNRSLTLRHFIHNKQPLGEDTEEVLKHIHTVWGFDVHLESVTPERATAASFHCPPKEKLELY